MIVALQLTALTIITLISFFGGPKQPAPPKDGFAVANGSQANVAQDQTQTAQDQTQTDQAQTQTAEPITAQDLTGRESRPA